MASDCRWLGEHKGGGRYACRSPLVTVPKAGITSTGCGQCSCRDHEEGATKCEPRPVRPRPPEATESLPRPSVYCFHLEPIIEHAACKCDDKHVRGCAIHDRCTTGPNDGSIATCHGCHERRPGPDAAPTLRTWKRNLAYFICPMPNVAWRRNVQQLRRRLDQFNGRRVAAIMTGDGFDPPEVVQSALGDSFEFILARNNPRWREVATFHAMLARMAAPAADEITFCAHAKGVSKPAHGSVRRWTDVMYETCLDYPGLVDALMERHPIAGSFKKVVQAFDYLDDAGVKRWSPSGWHYSGTFYWIRNDVFSDRDWWKIDPFEFGTESWPGLHFQPNEGGTIFHERRGQFDLYADAYWSSTVEPEYKEWRERHAGYYQEPRGK